MQRNQWARRCVRLTVACLMVPLFGGVRSDPVQAAAAALASGRLVGSGGGAFCAVDLTTTKAAWSVTLLQTNSPCLQGPHADDHNRPFGLEVIINGGTPAMEVLHSDNVAACRHEYLGDNSVGSHVTAHVFNYEPNFFAGFQLFGEEVSVVQDSCSPTAPTTPASKFLSYAGSQLELLPGEYLVVFNDAAVSAASIASLANALVSGTGGSVDHVFTDGVLGFSAHNLTDTWAITVSERPDVTFVRRNFRVYGKDLRGGVFSPVSWNLDRIDQQAPFALDRDYRFKTGPAGTAPPVPIYIIDNGIYQDHQQFMTGGASRVENVADVTGNNFARCPLAVPDANHGTSIASIAAGMTYGITPTLIKNIKVLDRGALGTSCTGGTATHVLRGLEETLRHMQNHNVTKAVVNLSVGWYASTPDVADLVSRVQAQGAVVVAAAGNENRDAAEMSPANLPNVMAIGATNVKDRRVVINAQEASNFGSIVALWAPGIDIKAADWPLVPTPNAVAYVGGTSMAAPHVAGAAALLWQQHPGMTTTQVMAALRDRAVRHMLLDLGPGSLNAMLYVGEEAPTPGAMHQLDLAGAIGHLEAVNVSNDWQRVYVAGGALSAGGAPTGPFAYAGYDRANLGAGPLWQVATDAAPATPNCVDIHASNSSAGPIPGEPVYFGCEGTHNGAPEAVVLATQQDNAAVWPQPAWLGPGSRMWGLTYAYLSLEARVFVIGNRPDATAADGDEVFLTALDAETGQVIRSVPLTAPGFTESFHRGVDVVVVDVAQNHTGTMTSSELIAATSTDPSGPDKTFLWKLDPMSLQVLSWREVPVPTLATNGMFATALAVQPLETNGNGLLIPGEVFLATMIGVSSGGGTTPWSYIFRLNPDHVTATDIEVVKDAHINDLWTGDGDVYFAGDTTRTFPLGSIYGTPNPGAGSNYDTFLGKSEGISNRRRWTVSFDNPGHTINTGAGGYGAKTGYIASTDWTTSYLIEFPVY